MLGSTSVICVYVFVVIIDVTLESLYGKGMYQRCHISLELHILLCSIILMLKNSKPVTNFTTKSCKWRDNDYDWYHINNIKNRFLKGFFLFFLFLFNCWDVNL